MSDLLIRDVDPEIKAELQARARRNGRNLSVEAQAVLRIGIASPEPEQALGARMASYFAGVGLTDGEWEIFNSAIEEGRNRPWTTPEVEAE